MRGPYCYLSNLLEEIIPCLSTNICSPLNVAETVDINKSPATHLYRDCRGVARGEQRGQLPPPFSRKSNNFRTRNTFSSPREARESPAFSNSPFVYTRRSARPLAQHCSVSCFFSKVLEPLPLHAPPAWQSAPECAKV